MAEWLKWVISIAIALLGVFVTYKQKKKEGRYIAITTSLLTAIITFMNLPDTNEKISTSEIVKHMDEGFGELKSILDQPSKTEILELPISEVDKATLSKVADLGAKGNPESVLQELADDSKILSELQTLSTNMAYRHFFRGVAYSDLKQWEKSFESFDHVVQYKADFVEAWYNRGVILGNLGRYEEEIKSYNEAIKYRPNHSNTWNNRGAALLNLGQYEEAVHSFDEAIKYNPSYPAGVWNNRGTALGFLNQYEKAVQSFDEAVKYKPDYVVAWYNRGIMLGNMEKYEEEIKSYDEAIKYQPGDADIWYNRGIASANLGKSVAAVKSFEQALKIAPADWPYRQYAIDEIKKSESSK